MTETLGPLRPFFWPNPLEGIAKRFLDGRTTRQRIVFPNVMIRLQEYWFPYAYMGDPLKLASTINSLANDSRLMMQP
jgi:hypothetical protein